MKKLVVVQCRTNFKIEVFYANLKVNSLEVDRSEISPVLLINLLIRLLPGGPDDGFTDMMVGVFVSVY